MVEVIETEEVNSASLCSDENYTRLFVVAQGGTLAGSSIYSIKHPKNNIPVAYRIGEEHCDEVLSVGDGYRSWFYGDSVVDNGSICLFSPIHPLFLALPYLLKNKSRFTELDEILCDKDNPGISILIKNKQLLLNIDKVSDSKKLCGTTVYRFNEGRSLQWIRSRFERLRTSLLTENALHKTIIENKDVMDRYTFAMLCDFLCPEMILVAKLHLSISDIPSEESQCRVGMSMKRKANDYDECISEKPFIKKSKESIVLKKLQQASKGTKSISSFFNKDTSY